MIIRYIFKYMIDISAYVISYVGPLGCTVAISNTLLHHLVAITLSTYHSKVIEESACGTAGN